MLISIITPCYNSGEFIEMCIDSIKNQNYNEIEHHIVDGESTDNTLVILKNTDGIKWVSEHDNGQSDAINKGLKMISGDIVAWQNADDVYLSGCFNKVAEYFSSHPEVYMVYGYYQRIDKDGKKLANVYSTNYKEWKLKYGRFIPVQPCVFFRKEVFEEVGLLDEDLNYCMDVDLYCRIAKRFKIARIPEFLGAFRVHKESKTQNKDNYKAVKNELVKVLNKYYRYSLVDRLIFELMQLRSRTATIIKDKALS